MAKKENILIDSGSSLRRLVSLATHENSDSVSAGSCSHRTTGRKIVAALPWED
jgi:hypothetical protein